MMNESLLRLMDATDTNTVGGKASALGTMLRSGYRIPDGFVLLASAFNKMTPRLEYALLAAYDELGASFVAVRSSAINEDGMDAAWAGQLDTFLNCRRKDLLQKVKSCWESADTARAQSYAQQKGIEGTQVAVIVQAMIDSDISGIAFSAHPVTGNETQVVLEAGFGLGEAVVSGQVTPDTYIVNKHDGELLEKHIGKQKRMLTRNADGENTWQDLGPMGDVQKLTQEQTVEICRLTRELEGFFKYPVDVEWAIMDGIIYILQCRPITTQPHKQGGK
jgi:phosphoenolpyruvate synthase/pyruvate phosphate dikinase